MTSARPLPFITSSPCVAPLAASLLVAAGAALLGGCTPTNYNAQISAEVSTAPALPAPLPDSTCGAACAGCCATDCDGASECATRTSEATTTPSPEGLAEILGEALEDEYRSRATYQAVIDAFGNVRPFANIVHAEGRHAAALLALFEAHGLSPPADAWASGVLAPSTLQEACEDAAAAERQNVDLYARLLALPAARADAEVERVLTALQRASQERHLPAFERCVARGGLVRGHRTPRRSGRGHRR